MAAIVTILKKKRDAEDDGQPRPPDGEPDSIFPQGRETYSKNTLDADKNGVISPDEIMDRLDDVCIRIDFMLQRLELETNMATMVLKMPFFLVCLFCFLAALVEFSPSSSVSKVHRHIESHFELSEATGIKNFDELYKFIEVFDRHNEELQATSSKYWCERRYFNKGWNVDLLVPHAVCRSPRLHALARGDENSRISWEELYSGSQSDHLSSHASSSSHTSSGSHSGSSHASSSSHSHGSHSGHRRLQAPRPCEDNNARLALEEAKPGATCQSQLPHICEVDLGLRLCMKTCGYCPPFEYDRLHKFAKRQVTMLPVVVFQTRLEQADCKNFAETYNQQHANPLLFLIPTLDGLKHDKVMTCIDYTRQFEREKAIEVECSPDSPSLFCKPCTYDSKKACLRETDKINFHGSTVYPQVLIEPHHDLMRLKALDWLDIQTDKVQVSTMIYTARAEIFTSLTVEFAIDEAGNFDKHVRIISYRDLTGSTKTTFIACLVTCSIGALVGVILSVVSLIRNRRACKWGFQVYELISRALLFVYPLVLLISWSAQVPMGKEYDDLLRVFLDLQVLEPSALYDSLVKFFAVKSHIYSETSWLKRQRVVANLVVYFQFWQLMLYFSAHPKMAMLTDTISKALTNIIHFLVLFFLLFFMMAFMAHWQLGEYISAFATYGDAISAQGRMIFGEFIYADGAERLHGVMMFMYWVYAFTFLLVIWGLLMNFFLAIVVDAFADIKEQLNSDAVTGNFFNDIFDVFYSLAHSYKYGWPSRQDLAFFLEDVQNRQNASASWLEELEEEQAQPQEEPEKVPVCFPEQLGSAFPNQFTNANQIAVFVCFYYNKIPRLLRRRRRKHAGAPCSEAAHAGDPKNIQLDCSAGSTAAVCLPGTVDSASP